jgi:hypothetical protein
VPLVTIAIAAAGWHLQRCVLLTVALLRAAAAAAAAAVDAIKASCMRGRCKR